jgi:hypothetical protein
MIVSLSVTIAAVVVLVVVADMGGRGEWDVGGGNLGCVLYCVAQIL